MQAGYGVFCGDRSDCNFAAHVPVTDRQSVSRGVLHALLQHKPGERLVVVLDSLYVYMGIVDWSPKWRCHGWRTPSGEVGHRDLWEQILWEQERAGAGLQVRWVPSHLGVEGNIGADRLAEQGRRAHPNNSRSLPKRPRRTVGTPVSKSRFAVSHCHREVGG
uniref:ribonuclease H n=1 Tax=Eutreptiella gymnastica TaxID=73025 RepID=A0A7S4CXH6_9EUGL